MIKKILEYQIQAEVEKGVNEQKINNWHKNIVKFGTITNTLIRACEISGKIVKSNLKTL